MSNEKSELSRVFDELQKERGKGRTIEIYRKKDNMHFVGKFEEPILEFNDVVAVLSNVKVRYGNEEKYRPRDHKNYIRLFGGNCEYHFA